MGTDIKFGAWIFSQYIIIDFYYAKIKLSLQKYFCGKWINIPDWKKTLKNVLPIKKKQVWYRKTSVHGVELFFLLWFKSSGDYYKKNSN